MNGYEVQLGDQLVMRDGEYRYTVRATTAEQLVLQDYATGKLHVIDRDGHMIPHLRKV